MCICPVIGRKRQDSNDEAQARRDRTCYCYEFHIHHFSYRSDTVKAADYLKIQVYIKKVPFDEQSQKRRVIRDVPAKLLSLLSFVNNVLTNLYGDLTIIKIMVMSDPAFWHLSDVSIFVLP